MPFSSFLRAADSEPTLQKLCGQKITDIAIISLDTLRERQTEGVPKTNYYETISEDEALMFLTEQVNIVIMLHSAKYTLYVKEFPNNGDCLLEIPEGVVPFYRLTDEGGGRCKNIILRSPEFSKYIGATIKGISAWRCFDEQMSKAFPPANSPKLKTNTFCIDSDYGKFIIIGGSYIANTRGWMTKFTEKFGPMDGCYIDKTFEVGDSNMLDIKHYTWNERDAEGTNR